MEHRVNTKDLLQHQVGGDDKINLINTLNKFRPNTFVNPYNYSFDLYKNLDLLDLMLVSILLEF
jgi:hypothetical protein